MKKRLKNNSLAPAKQGFEEITSAPHHAQINISLWSVPGQFKLTNERAKHLRGSRGRFLEYILRGRLTCFRFDANQRRSTTGLARPHGRRAPQLPLCRRLPLQLLLTLFLSDPMRLFCTHYSSPRSSLQAPATSVKTLNTHALSLYDVCPSAPGSKLWTPRTVFTLAANNFFTWRSQCPKWNWVTGSHSSSS